MPSSAVMAIAHRGASAEAPENTIVAFDEAIRCGASAVEFDVRLSADGIPVVIHDETVDRTTNGCGRVQDHHWVDLRRLDAGSWLHHRYAGVRIPSLDEALAAISPFATAVIDLKVPIDPAVLVRLLHKYEAHETTVFVSFDIALIQALQEYDPSVQVGLSVREWLENLPAYCSSQDIPLLMLPIEEVSLERIHMADALGLEVWCYTANDIGLVAACSAMGISGIVTDVPNLIRRKVRE